jgi:hypothetical protein
MVDKDLYTSMDGTRKTIADLMKKGNKDSEPKKGCGCVNKCPHTISNSVGEQVIVVTRDSFNIQLDLPFAIWGTLYLQSNFGQILQPYLPATVTFVSSVVNSAGNMVFTFTNGPETDTITVGVPGIGLISYNEMLNSLKTSYWKSCYMLFNCNARNTALFLDNSVILEIQSKGLFIQKVGAAGNKSAQLIIPKNRLGNNNSVSNIVEIYLRNEPIKPDSVWIHSFPYVNFGLGIVSNLEYNYTVFITDTVDMNKL